MIDVLTRDGLWVEAYWALQNQAFVRWRDAERRTLRVLAWREAPARRADRPMPLFGGGPPKASSPGGITRDRTQSSGPFDAAGDICLIVEHPEDH